MMMTATATRITGTVSEPLNGSNICDATRFSDEKEEKKDEETQTAEKKKEGEGRKKKAISG